RLLAAGVGSHLAAPLLFPGANGDPLPDFEPIGITAHAPVVIVARKDFPARDLAEFVALLKQKGGGDLKQAHGGGAAATSSGRRAAAAPPRIWPACCSPPGLVSTRMRSSIAARGRQ